MKKLIILALALAPVGAQACMISPSGGAWAQQQYELCVQQQRMVEEQEQQTRLMKQQLDEQRRENRRNECLRTGNPYCF